MTFHANRILIVSVHIGKQDTRVALFAFKYSPTETHNFHHGLQTRRELNEMSHFYPAQNIPNTTVQWAMLFRRGNRKGKVVHGMK